MSISGDRNRWSRPILLAMLALVAMDSSAEQRKPKVVATTVQITALAKEVGGSTIQLKGLVPAGADPHEFEPVASDLVALEGADLILRHGIGLDDWLDRTLKAGKKAKLVTVTAGVRPRKGEVDGKPVDDAHVWHDPTNAKKMVDNIAAALDRADPANKPTYDANAVAYKKKLDAAAAQVQAVINEISPANRKLVTNHDALGYFARAYGLKIVGAVIPAVSTQAEPSAADTAALLEAIKREKVKAIFAESNVNPKLATTLAKEAGVKIVDDLYGDSLGQPGSGAETVDGMWLANARKIADALK
ncbi:MAG TPA: zinc ABC transporter substrate-binding protein [Methylomirabilota bacterium]|jgi:ABC-type Zn uptake system ZnuABC Zn-binding protein ZnuA|nr:zinc ABC transporter substrate-binding protein [Methylomirabilota bacterium]